MKDTVNPLVTICIPVYNGDKYIIDALVSIKNQTYTNFECHIVNNASTDKTKEFVSKFIKEDQRFILHNHEEFVDINDNWNRTVNYLSDRSKYFKVVQADDIIFPDSLTVFVELMEKYPGAGIGSAYRIVEKNVIGYGLDYLQGNLFDGKDILIRHLMDQAEITGSISQLFFRVETLKKLPFYPKIFIPDDVHFDARLAYELYAISDLVFSFTVLSYTRRHPDAETVSYAEKVNTFIHSKECRLHRFSGISSEIAKKYRNHRRKYAYFLLKRKLFGDRNCLKWHNKYLKRKFNTSEYISGIIWENRFGHALSRRLKN